MFVLLQRNINKLLIASMALSSSGAIAADRFSVVSIANETKANVTIAYRWGNAPLKTEYLPAGDHHWFAYQYSRPDEDRSPDFVANFDADTGSGKYHEQKRLHGYRAPEQNFALGHKYVFRYNGPSQKYIELYESK